MSPRDMHAGTNDCKHAINMDAAAQASLDCEHFELCTELANNAEGTAHICHHSDCIG